ncbi:MAG: sugar phosphate isomerase/epimerase family protein [Planctomycetota bacterium]|jgi:sugar phosphate isomerase/epimerase
MKTLQGPAIFLAQYMGEEPPFNDIESAAEWAGSLGFRGVQVPTWDPNAIDLDLAAESKDYCEDYRAKMAAFGVEPTELATHLQGQVIAVHPAYDKLFDGFAPAAVHGDSKARTAWGVDQVRKSLRASRNLGLKASVTFSGALAWPYMYPWPPRPAGLVDEAFAELGRRWRPLLDEAEECGIDLCFEIHPGEDLHDGVTWERFLEEVDGHPRAHILYDPSHFVLQGLDYLHFIDLYHERIKMFHVKDAELCCDGRVGVYGGYQDWGDRAGRFRSLGDGQTDFVSIFTKLAKYDFEGWAVLEWECAYKDNLVGAAEGAQFIADHIIEVSKSSFDDFAESGVDRSANRSILGLE